MPGPAPRSGLGPAPLVPRGRLGGRILPGREVMVLREALRCLEEARGGVSLPLLVPESGPAGARGP
eukprot:15479151-Alexandrium_andersonii.AAC.1